MSYKFDIDPKNRVVARFIGEVRSELVRAFVEESAASGLTRDQLAQLLGVHKSLITKRLRGNVNLTLRSIGEMAWALDREPEFTLAQPDEPAVSANQALHTEGGVQVEIARTDDILTDTASAGG